MTVRKFTVDLWDSLGHDDDVMDIPVQDGAFYTDEDSDAGAFEFTIHNDEPSATNLDEGRVVTFSIAGTPDRLGVIERPSFTPKHVQPVQRVTTVRGRDVIAEFDRYRIPPPLGWGSKPAVPQVTFNWLHPNLDRSGWTNPVYMGPLFKADLDPLGNPSPAPWSAKPGDHPSAWPDGFTAWVWPTATDGTNSHPVDQRAYWYLPIPLIASPLVLIHTSDDQGALGFDGALVDAGVNPPAVQWMSSWAVGMDDVSASTHYVTGRSVNSFNSAVNNPGAFACIGYQQVVSPFLQYENVKFRTGSDTAGGDPMLGGDWLCTYRNAGDPEPGFTPGRAFRILFEQAQSYGFFADWTLNFTDTLDSNGDAWASTSLLSARVADDTLLDVVRNWHDLGFWDAWSSPNAKTLNATAWGNRGNFHLGGAAVNWHDDQVISTKVDSKA